MRDGRVSITLKLVTAAFALLILSPLNFLGDIPLLGFFDDAALLLMLSTWFVNQAVKHVERRVTPVPAHELAVH